MMKYDAFIILTNESEPPNNLSGVHLAIWYAVKDNWDMAHNIIQEIIWVGRSLKSNRENNGKKKGDLGVN